MSNVEKIKKDSNFLRGDLAKSFLNKITGAISKEDQIVIKFHGSYQQDDRDVRQRRAQKKLERLYSFMLRLRIAGGKISASQWLGINEIADNYASDVIKITTRQTVQLHGVAKFDLKTVISSFYNHFGLDSIAACGDVNRNVMVSTAIAKNKAYDEVYEYGKKISEYLLPKTNAYNEIWLDGEQIENKQEEPFYKETYLPRKFKIAIAIPPFNDVDVYAHDIGLIAIIEKGELLGFNVIAGGGMGRTHDNDATFARIGDLIGFVEKEKILDAVYQIGAIQRDFGNRQERANSRFKYTVEKHGTKWLLEKFEQYFGQKMSKAREFSLTKRIDEYGFDEDYLGNWHFTLFVENGRVFGDIRKALTEIAQLNLANFRFSNNQNIVISDISSHKKQQVAEILEQYQILEQKFSPIRLNAMACVALNTCGLALAEGQRYLPELITKIEEILQKLNLAKEQISIRMTGCPNGCARPYLAEIGLVGRSLGHYDLHLGGDHLGKRLNKLYKKNLPEIEILHEIGTLLQEYGESPDKWPSFGDFIFHNKLKNF